MSSAADERAIGEAYARLFEGLELLGPVTDPTRRAVLASFRHELPAAPVAVDMGCGAGVASRLLAAELPGARVLAADTHRGFLARVLASARSTGARILPVVADMARPPIAPASVDLVWCDSAIYGVGRVVGLEAWRPLLRPGGRVAFSDVVRSTPAPPERARAFWAREYPSMTTADGVEADVRAAGCATERRLEAPVADWRAYYAPLRRRLEDLSPTASGALAEVLDVMREEIAVFDAYGEHSASTWFVVRPAG